MTHFTRDAAPAPRDRPGGGTAAPDQTMNDPRDFVLKAPRLLAKEKRDGDIRTHPGR